MVNDIFGSSLGGAAAAAAATAFPATMAMANTSGRLAWGPTSDLLGSGRALALCGIAMPSLMLCSAATSLATTDAHGALNLFRTGAFGTCFVFAGVPIMIALASADLFGKRSAGQIYQRLWITIPIANVAGTTLVSKARDYSYASHASRIAELCDDQAFAAAFGASKAELPSLLHSKTVTIPLLLQIAPEGTADPSPLLYNEVLYMLTGISGLALACNVAAFRWPIRRAARAR